MSRVVLIEVRKPFSNPLAVFKMAGYRETPLTSLVTRPGSSSTLAIV